MAAAYHMSRIDRIYRTYTLTATDENGAPATLTGVDFALIAPDSNSPGTGTDWTPGSGSGETWQVLLAGPDADPTDAIVVPSWGGKVVARVTDSPEVIAEVVDVIAVD